ncbi:MAG: hypothetical protein ACYSUK_00060 [Planctomycetota bacterium]|jgi:hypothetical protein
MSDFYSECVFEVGHPDGWKFVIREADEEVINIEYYAWDQTKKEWGNKRVHELGLWGEAIRLVGEALITKYKEIEERKKT